MPLKQLLLTQKGMSTSLLPAEAQSITVQPIFIDDIQMYIEAMSLKLLDSTERKTPQEWQSEYRNMALARGFPLQGTGLSAQALTRAFISYFNSGSLELAKLSLRGENQSWAACLLRQSETSDVTAKHILMNVFLHHAPLPQSVLTQLPGRKSLDCASMDRQFANAISARIQTLESGARLTVKQLLKELAILEPVRHHRASLPQTNALLEAFLCSDFSARQSGRRPRKKAKN